MRLTGAQQREHRRVCLDFDRRWISGRSDEALRWAVRAAASHDPRDERCFSPCELRCGEISAGPLTMFRLALLEEVLRRVAYPPGAKLPPVRLDPLEPAPAPRNARRRKSSEPQPAPGGSSER